MSKRDPFFSASDREWMKRSSLRWVFGMIFYAIAIGGVTILFLTLMQWMGLIP